MRVGGEDGVKETRQQVYEVAYELNKKRSLYVRLHLLIVLIVPLSLTFYYSAAFVVMLMLSPDNV